MTSIIKTLRAAADPNRLRILLLLKEEGLSVAELQEALTMGQSTISTHLAQLKQAGLVEDRRTGKSNLYRLAEPAAGDPLRQILASAGQEIVEAEADRAAVRRIVLKRQDSMRHFFDSVAGRQGKDYVPGKSWKSTAEALFRLLPPMTIADLGAGEGDLSLLLSRTAKHVIAVDSSTGMIEVGRALLLRHGVTNVEFRLGDLVQVPIGRGEMDVAIFSQSLHHAINPARAISEAARILVPGGRIVILDLVKHRYERARELYADEWLGFGEAELEAMLIKEGFTNVEIGVVDREKLDPHFQTLLAVGRKTE